MQLPDIPKTFTIHLVVSYILVGIVLLTQFISYPMYNILPSDVLYLYQSNYMIRAFILIGPFMLIEMLTGIRLAMKVRNFELHRTLRGNISIIAIIWIITFVFELPSHLLLLFNGFSQQLYTTILVFNFLRLVLWIIKARMLTKIARHFYRTDRRIFDEDFLDE